MSVSMRHVGHVHSHKCYAYYKTYDTVDELINAMRRDIRIAQVWGYNPVELDKIIKCGNDALLKMGACPVKLLGANVLKHMS